MPGFLNIKLLKFAGEAVAGGALATIGSLGVSSALNSYSNRKKRTAVRASTMATRKKRKQYGF